MSERLRGRTFRLRSLMMLVAGVAILLAVGSMLWRRHRFQQVAAMHASLETQHRDAGRFWFTDRGRVQTLGETNRDRFLVQYHAELKQKYEKAARRPWLIVKPDPSALF